MTDIEEIVEALAPECQNDKEDPRPIGKKAAKKAKKDERNIAGLAESSRLLAESSIRAKELSERKVTTLELMMEHHIMVQNLDGMDEVSREYYVMQKREILKKMQERICQ